MKDGWRPILPSEPRPRAAFDWPNYSIAEAMAIKAVDDPRFVFGDKHFAIWGLGDDGMHHPVPDPMFSRLHDGTQTESINVAKSEIVDNARGKRWSDVRCIPVLRAPNTAVLLRGLTLSDVFETIILNDDIAFMVRTEAKCVLEFLPHVFSRKIFGEKPFLYFSNNDTNLCLKCFFHLERTCGKQDRDTLWKYANAVGGKASDIIDSLTCGRIKADGFWRNETRDRHAIDKGILGLNGLALDLNTFDIIDTNTSAIEWRSIVLRGPAVDFQPTDIAKRDGCTTLKHVAPPSDDLILEFLHKKSAGNGGFVSQDSGEKIVRRQFPQITRDKARELVKSLTGNEKRGPRGPRNNSAK